MKSFTRRSSLSIACVMYVLLIACAPLLGAAPALDMEQAKAEVSRAYGKAHPEVQEFVLHTARSFGQSGLWLNENAYADLTPEQRDARVVYLAKLFEEAEYGRHLCNALAEASAVKDPRLVPGLMKFAGYHLEDHDYDCRPKWMAIAALARQESADAVPFWSAWSITGIKTRDSGLVPRSRAWQATILKRTSRPGTNGGPAKGTMRSMRSC